jgi:hypothetical protein
MRIFSSFGIASVIAFNVQAQTVVPDSMSPDGKTALYYRHLPSKPMNEGYELYFRDNQSVSPLSENLIPAVRTDCTTDSAMDDMESGILLGGIGSHLEASRNHILWDPAFSYFVAWSPNSQWVSIEGGAHKFWRAMIYHSVDDRFARVMLPDSKFGAYFNAHKNELHVQDLGASTAIRKISPRNYDYPNVCWLGNGILAINAYPYLLRNPDYLKLETHNLFFLLNVGTNPATITGFCK